MCELVVLVQTKSGEPVGVKEYSSLADWIQQSGYEQEDGWNIYLQAELWSESRGTNDDWKAEDMLLISHTKDGFIEIATPAYLRVDVQNQILGKSTKKIDL